MVPPWFNPLILIAESTECVCKPLNLRCPTVAQIPGPHSHSHSPHSGSHVCLTHGLLLLKMNSFPGLCPHIVHVHLVIRANGAHFARERSTQTLTFFSRELSHANKYTQGRSGFQLGSGRGSNCREGWGLEEGSIVRTIDQLL